MKKGGNDMVEVWKDVVGYEGLYMVSNLGRVKSLRGNKERILKGYYHRGYRRVDLYKNGVMKHWRIHRLVAQAFIDNPNNYPVVNHRDEDKSNNRVDNLEWCTHEYNVNYSRERKKLREQFS